jgi:hypothetical protein
MGDETENSHEERFSGLVGLKAIDLQQRILLSSQLHGQSRMAPGGDSDLEPSIKAFLVFRLQPFGLYNAYECSSQ